MILSSTMAQWILTRLPSILSSLIWRPMMLLDMYPIKAVVLS
jgi:hypothetical protein